MMWPGSFGTPSAQALCQPNHDDASRGVSSTLSVFPSRSAGATFLRTETITAFHSPFLRYFSRSSQRSS